MVTCSASSVYLMQKIRLIYDEPIYNTVTYCFNQAGRALLRCPPARRDNLGHELRQILARA